MAVSCSSLFCSAPSSRTLLFVPVPTLIFVTSFYLSRPYCYFVHPFSSLSVPPHRPSPMRDASSSPHLPLARSQAPAPSLSVCCSAVILFLLISSLCFYFPSAQMHETELRTTCLIRKAGTLGRPSLALWSVSCLAPAHNRL